MDDIVKSPTFINPIFNNYADPGPIPDFLLRQASKPPPPDLGCATQPSDPIKAGQQAWARLQAHQTWEDWMAVGFALAEGRTKAMAAAKTNQPRGSCYNKIYSGWLGARGFDLGKSTRARLLECTENIGAINAWLQTLKADKRLKLNHPTTVLSAWKRSTAPKSEPDEKPTSDWDLFFKRFTLQDFVGRMPPEWRDELLRRRDNLDKSRPDSKVTATIKAALGYVAAANDPNTTKTVAASNEYAALNNLRGALRVLAGHDRTLHDVEIRLIPAKSKRKRAA
jgi:hypothetical protein